MKPSNTLRKPFEIARAFGDRQGEASHLGCLGIAWELLPIPPKPPEFVFVNGDPHPWENDRRRSEHESTIRGGE
jgi:hypothetical protein